MLKYLYIVYAYRFIFVAAAAAAVAVDIADWCVYISFQLWQQKFDAVYGAVCIRLLR